MRVHLENLEISWKYHGILSLRKSRNPEYNETSINYSQVLKFTTVKVVGQGTFSCTTGVDETIKWSRLFGGLDSLVCTVPHLTCTVRPRGCSGTEQVFKIAHVGQWNIMQVRMLHRVSFFHHHFKFCVNSRYVACVHPVCVLENGGVSECYTW